MSLFPIKLSKSTKRVAIHTYHWVVLLDFVGHVCWLLRFLLVYRKITVNFMLFKHWSRMYRESLDPMIFKAMYTCGRFEVFTLPETNSSHLKMDGWSTTFLWGWPIFRCKLLVSGRVVLGHSSTQHSLVKIVIYNITGWWFQILFIFTPTWGHDPI